MKTLFNTKKWKTLLGVALIATSLTIMSGCKKESGKFTVLLTDAPGDYKQVNVEILKVSVHIDATQDKQAGWYDLVTNAGIYDLIALQNVTTPLANGDELPAGDITEMRLILGANNSVVDNFGVSFPLTVPSGSQTGIKIKYKLERKDDTQVILDFDAALSVEHSGNGYKLNPVIKLK